MLLRNVHAPEMFPPGSRRIHLEGSDQRQPSKNYDAISVQNDFSGGPARAPLYKRCPSAPRTQPRRSKLSKGQPRMSALGEGGRYRDSLASRVSIPPDVAPSQGLSCSEASVHQ